MFGECDSALCNMHLHLTGSVSKTGHMSAEHKLEKLSAIQINNEKGRKYGDFQMDFELN